MVAAKRETTRMKSTITKSKVVQYPWYKEIQTNQVLNYNVLFHSACNALTPRHQCSSHKRKPRSIVSASGEINLLNTLLSLIARSLVINE